MLRFLKGLVIVLVSLAAGGAVAYFGLLESHPLPSPPRAALPVPPALDAALACDPAEPLSVTLGAWERFEGHDTVTGRIAVRRAGGPAHEATFRFYRADEGSGIPVPHDAARSALRPVAIITPILGGDNDVERLVADDLARHGMCAMIVDRRLPRHPSFEGFEEALKDMVAARRRLMDWLERSPPHPSVDRERLCGYGVSLGAMTTTLLTAVEPRVKAAVVVMGGGPWDEVLSTSVEGEARILRDDFGAGAGSPPEKLDAFRARAREVMLTDPLRLAPHVDPRKLFTVTTRRDTSVATVNQVKLHEALGRPEMLSLPTGHYSAALYLPVLTRAAREFLWRRLYEGPAATR